MEIDTILGKIEENKLRWILLQYVSLEGTIHTVHVNAIQFNRESFERGYSIIDPSEFGNGKEITIVPEPTTYSLLPWAEGIGRFICYEKDNYSTDNRNILNKCSDLLEKEEFIPYVGASLDFMLLENLNFSEMDRSFSFTADSIEANNPNSPQPYSINDKNSLNASAPEDKSEAIRLQITDSLEQFFNVTVEKHYHAKGIAKNCIVLGHRKPLNMADNVITSKYACKNIAILNNKICSFMPKILKDVQGNTLRITISLFKKDTNIFAKNQEILEYFISGLIDHIKSVFAFTNPTVNSYKRIKFDKISFNIQERNKNAFINLPTFYQDREVRLELNFPDTSANPYNAIAAVLLAGFDGIKRKKRHMSFNKGKIEVNKEPEIPNTLNSAIEELINDNNYLKPVFSKEYLEYYVEYKSQEIKNSLNDINNSDYKMYLKL
ncbi:MAG: glutamine synthetase family protein [Candidatus Micrarchaeota archaeon]|nr:glutamine synthetase family protein [Candidatus Micrarchaeota archaeon]